MNSIKNESLKIVENLIIQTHSFLLVKVFEENDQSIKEKIKEIAQKNFSKAFSNVSNIETNFSQIEIEKTLGILQKKIVNSSINYFKLIITEFTPIIDLDPFRINNLKKSKSKSKIILPSTQDANETIEDHRENTSKYFILQTLYLSFETMIQNNKSNEFSIVSQELIESISSHLELIYSKAVRFIAGQCLGSLTEYDDHFQMLSSLFLTQIKPTSRKNARSLVTYEKAIKCLKFEIANSVRANLTLKFLDSYITILGKIDRGVHRKEACKTLSEFSHRFFPQINDDSKTQNQKTENILNLQKEYLNLYQNFMDSLEKCYNIVLKWSKKTKHMIFCYHYLLSTISNSIKNNPTLRITYLQLANKFYHNLANEFIESDSKTFINMTKSFILFLLPNITKKTTQINNEEIELISTTISTMGEKKIDTTLEIIIEHLKNPELRFDYKIAIVKSLGLLVEKHSKYLSENKEIFPLISSILLEPRKLINNTYDEQLSTKNIPLPQIQLNEMLVAASLSTFPCICSQKEEENAIIIQNLVELTLHDNREISNFAFLGLQKMISKDPSQSSKMFNYIFKLMLKIFENIGHFIEVSIKIQDNFASFFKLSQQLSFIITSFQANLKTSESHNPSISLKTWVSLRIQFEACCLLWLSCPEIWIGMEISRLMSTFHNSQFQNFENQLIQIFDSSEPEVTDTEYSETEYEKNSFLGDIPYLADACINTIENLEQNQLFQFIHSNYSEYSYSFNYAWNSLCQYFINSINTHTFLSYPDSLQSGLSKLIWNQFHFLCSIVDVSTHSIKKLIQVFPFEKITEKHQIKPNRRDTLMLLTKTDSESGRNLSKSSEYESTNIPKEELNTSPQITRNTKFEIDKEFVEFQTFDSEINLNLLSNFFVIALRFLLSDKESIRNEAINHIIDMQPNSFLIFLSVISDYEKKLVESGNQQKFSSILKSIQDSLLPMILEFIKKVPVSFVNESKELNEIMDSVFSKWTQNGVEKLDISNKNNLDIFVSITSVYFDKIQKNENQNQNQNQIYSIIMFLIQLFDESILKKIQNKEEKKKILQNSFNSLAILLNLYKNENQELKIGLEILNKAIGLATELNLDDQQIQYFLFSFLKNNIQHCNFYLDQSFDLIMNEKETSRLKLTHFFQALVQNIKENPDKWISDEKIGIPIHKILALILIHINSEENNIRSFAHDLVIGLSKLKNNPIHPGKEGLNVLASITHPNQHVYFNLAKKYFDSIAPKFPQYSSQIIMEISKKVKFLQQQTRFRIVQLLRYFTRNFPHFVSKEIESAKNILDSMIELSNEFFNDNYLIPSLSSLWKSLFGKKSSHNSTKDSDTVSNSKAKILDFVLEHLLQKFTPDKDQKTTTKYSISLLKVINVNICRKDPKYAFKFFAKYLMNFKVCSSNINKFYKETKEKITESSPYQETIILLLDDLIFENGIFCVEEIPVFLQHSFVKNPNNEIGNNIIYYLINSLVIQYSQKQEIKKNSEELLELIKSMQKSKLLERNEKNAKILSMLVDFFQELQPNFGEKWKDIMFSWAIRTEDEKLANNCLNGFYLLTKNYPELLIQRLIIFGLSTFEQQKWELFGNITAIFTEIIKNHHKELSAESFTQIAKFGSLLLFSYSSKIFEKGLEIMSLLALLKPQRNFDPNQIFINTMPIWLDKTKSSQRSSVDTPIIRAIIRGFTIESFVDSSMEILEMFAISMEKVLSTQNNHLLLSYILICGIVFLAGQQEEAKEKIHQFSQKCKSFHKSFSVKFYNLFKSNLKIEENNQENEFITEFFKIFAESSQTNGYFFISILKIFLLFSSNQNHQLKIIILKMIPSVLTSFRMDWNQIGYEELLDILKITSHSTSSIVVQESEKVFSSVFPHISHNVSIDGLDFINKQISIEDLKLKSIKEMKQKILEKQIYQGFDEDLFLKDDVFLERFEKFKSDIF
ncbi:hypothetical protein M0811_08061 [Anaeramoeba ignava]|uniref:Uncharacterized protein n=1 Tax=Anaeramoeba ignava TaxID=1746090 RepID=A0A9Q0LJQ8_ANAIG|nr:hypothetical protein M0811_08061 [Anaeramoeba ignava]